MSAVTGLSPLHSATSWLCLSFTIYKITLLELWAILSRISNKRTQKSSSQSDSDVIAFVADITRNKVDPVFPAIKWGQVKDSEETINIQAQSTREGETLPRS